MEFYEGVTRQAIEICLFKYDHLNNVEVILAGRIFKIIKSTLLFRFLNDSCDMTTMVSLTKITFVAAFYGMLLLIYLDNFIVHYYSNFVISKTTSRTINIAVGITSNTTDR